MSKIYKIEFNDCIYFGSTKQKYLSNRQKIHNFRLRNSPTTRLYKEAIKNGIEKLECILICECAIEERFLKENELIKNETDKIVLNELSALFDKEKQKETRKKYEMSEKRKEYQRNYQMTEKRKEYQRQYYEKQKQKKLSSMEKNHPI